MLTEKNPMIRVVTIGKKRQRDIKIFPLSIRDQFQMSNILSAIIAYAINAIGKPEQQFMLFMLGLIKNNLSQVLDLVTEQSLLRRLRRKFIRVPWRYPEHPLLKEITLDQAGAIAQMIYEMNYELSLKKVQGLLDGTVEVPEALRRLWQFFSGGIPSTGTKISMENPGPKAE